MGVITEYFAASTDELAAAVLAGGPSQASPPLASIETKGLDPVVVVGSLEEILTGRDYDVVVENPRQGAEMASDDGALVIAITSELRDALAGADEAEGSCRRAGGD